MKNVLKRLGVGIVIGLVMSATFIGSIEFVNYLKSKDLASRLAQAAIEQINRDGRLSEPLPYDINQALPMQEAHAGSLTDFGENKLVDALLRGQAIGTPATWYLALGTSACTDAGPDTEVSTSGTGYARQPVTAALTSWAGTQSAGSTVASSGTGGTTSNNAAITWAASTAAWGTIQSVIWYDAVTAGNRWICINLTSSLNVSGTGFTVSFASGQLSFQIDN